MALSKIIFGKVFGKSSRFVLCRNVIKSATVVNVSKLFYTTDKESASKIIVKIQKGLQDKPINLGEADKTIKSKLTSDDATNKYLIAVISFSLLIITVYVVYEFGKPSRDQNNIIIPDEYSDLPIWKQHLRRFIKTLYDVATVIQEPSREKLLPDPFQYPYFQPPYTLVLEFTDLLAHPDWTYKTGWRFKKRPGLDYLLENLVGLYEIVVFTAESGITIFPVIEAVDPNNCISYKLVRDSTHFVDGHHVKNISKLNRDLSKVIVVDWNSESVKFHPENHLQIKKWDGEDDEVLIDLTVFLKTIAQTEIEDVRDVLIYYKQYEDPLKTFRQKQHEYFEMQQQQLYNMEQKSKNKPNWFQKFLF